MMPVISDKVLHAAFLKTIHITIIVSLLLQKRLRRAFDQLKVFDPSLEVLVDGIIVETIDILRLEDIRSLAV